MEVNKYKVVFKPKFSRDTIIYHFKARIMADRMMSATQKIRKVRKLDKFIKQIDIICSDEPKKLKKVK